MQVLFLTQIVPWPADSGPKIKTQNVLRYLAARHSIHLISFVRNEAEQTHAQSLKQVCETVTTVPLQRSRRRDAAAMARSLTNGRPFLVERDDSRAMRRAVADLLECRPVDAAHADQLTMAQFAVGLPVARRVLDEHNAVWTIVRRAAARERGVRRLLAELEWRKLRAYEGGICRRFDWVTVVSAEDRRFLEEPAGTPLRAPVIPIAVDTEQLAVIPRTAAARHVLSVATMFYPPNVEGVYWFATEVFPLVRQRLPDVRFSIVGSRPPERIARLAGDATGVAVTGYVPDLEPVLRLAGVLVVPLHAGSGMRVKILEAFARGIPVVSTTIGVEGIEARSGEHLLVADEPAAFAQAVTRVLTDHDLAACLAAAARRLVEERYDWRTALRGLDAIYPPAEGPVAPPPGPPPLRSGQALPSVAGEGSAMWD
jgi:hypothetical protein